MLKAERLEFISGKHKRGFVEDENELGYCLHWLYCNCIQEITFLVSRTCDKENRDHLSTVTDAFPFLSQLILSLSPEILCNHISEEYAQHCAKLWSALLPNIS